MFLDDFLSNFVKQVWVKVFDINHAIITVLSSAFNVHLFDYSHLYVE